MAAKDANAVGIILETILLERGYVNESEVTDNKEKANIAYNLAYRVVLAAIDVVRNKLKIVQTLPTKIEYRDMVKDFQELLKRLGKLAGLDEDPQGTATFEMDIVPYHDEVS